MKHVKPSGTMSLLLLSAQIVYAQAITEYEKTFGGVSQRSRSANPQASKEQVRPGKGSGGFQGVGDVGGRPLAPRLIVVGQKLDFTPVKTMRHKR
jgi:hypothetical protein